MRINLLSALIFIFISIFLSGCTTQDLAKEKCGDMVCSTIEEQIGACPHDCSHTSNWPNVQENITNNS